MKTVDFAGKAFTLPKEWTYGEGSRVQAPISWWKDYVVSHRAGQHTCSYRPPGQHHHVGNYETAQAAFAAAKMHDSQLKLRAIEMTKIKLTMEMTAGGAYPADEIPAMRENVFHLIKRIELSLLNDKLTFSVENAGISIKLQRAALKALDEDLALARELLNSLKIEVL